MTACEYQTTPEGPPWFELIEGRLLQEPSPTTDHQSIQGNLYFALRCHLERNPVARVLLAPLDVYLDEFNVFQPDVLLVLSESASIVARHGVVGAPDWVVEILSPSNRSRDMGPKRAVYARAGVKRLWIVDPEAQSVADYDFAANAEAPVRVWISASAGPITCPLLPGFALEWKRLFGPR